MGLKPKLATGGDDKFKVAPGKYRARCVAVCDLGEQAYEWKGEKRKSEKVWLGFALENGQEKGQTFTNSLGPKSNLYKAVNGWLYGHDMTPEDQAEFGCDRCLGEYCTLIIVRGNGDHTKIENIQAAEGEEDFAQDHPLCLVDEGEYLKGDESMVPPFIAEMIEPATSF